ncbi:MAG: SprT-like domain-containing protein [Flavobacteriales bacterium]|nr:SprT-like domain-containing protein [Flavobacteriales bacterium]
MNRESRIRHAISPFVPSGTEISLAKEIVKYRCHLTITRDRRTKSGDYRHPSGKNGHRISVNGSLNPYAFLITFIHELAHLVNWERQGNRVNPHGKEWKSTFKEVMQPFLKETIFPPDILPILVEHMKNPKSATFRDLDLMRSLRKHDEESEYILLEDVVEGDEFSLGKRRFRKGEKLRKRYRCKEVGSGRIYMVSAIAEVML